MNENENKQENYFEDTFSELVARNVHNANSENNGEAEKKTHQAQKVSFGFPHPPVNEPVQNEGTDNQQLRQPEPEFNPYAEPKSDTAEAQANPYVASQSFSQPPYYPQQNYSQNQRNQQSFSQQQNRYQFGSQPYQVNNVEPPKKPKGKKTVAVLISACLIFAAVIGAVSLFGDSFSDPIKNTTDPLSSGLATESDDLMIETTKTGLVDEINSVVVAEKVRPSVVGVLVYYRGQLEGEGSGVLWKEENGYTYVITCAHVIEGSGVTYGILLLDGSYYEAEFLGADTRTDIGVLKFEATGLDLAEMGDSDSLKIGEPVYAIGNPGGSNYFGSMTDGIISAIDRSIDSTYKMTVIQHNAAINPGNSGGALVNTAGQIIGINSSKISDTEYEGMGFAVPASIALPIAQALAQYGYVPNRPKLGIEYAAASSYQIYSLVVSIKGLPQGSLVIAGISSDSSLNQTDAEVGDLIIAVNGKDMDDSSVLLDLIETGAVGDTLTLTLCRIEQRTYKTKTFDVTITLVEDKGSTQEETTEAPTNPGDYYYGGSGSFEDFFDDYFGW